MRHDLKTWREPYEAILVGIKKCEVRKNDRNFRIGDELRLKEYDSEREEFTGRYCTVYVTHVVLGGRFGLPEDLCVMSIQP